MAPLWWRPENWDELAAGLDLKGFPVANRGGQTGGWFRKDMNTVDDLKDLKMHMPGLGVRGPVIGRMLKALVVPVVPVVLIVAVLRAILAGVAAPTEAAAVALSACFLRQCQDIQ